MHKPLYYSKIDLNNIQNGLTVYDHYCQNHLKDDIDSLIQVINDIYGENNMYVYHLLTDTKLYMGSTFIFKRALFNNICNFVFTVLDNLDTMLSLHFEYENYKHRYLRLINAENCDDKKYLYQRRGFGYLAERLISVYLTSYYSESDVQLMSQFE